MVRDRPFILLFSFSNDSCKRSNVGQEELTWTERILLVHSPVHQQQQQRGLQQRLTTATAKIQALTPFPGRGKRQIRDEATLHQKV